MPNPSSGETQSDFMKRCVPMVMHENPNTQNDQAVAICYSKWRGESIHPHFERILGLFLKRFKEQGLAKFENFILKNNLDPTKIYNPKAQFQESFEWIEPLIRPYKEDAEAKYYLVTALTADISLNNVDYGPIDRMEDAAPTLSWRPVNLDHDHTKWFPYPRTRTDFSTANEFSVEATLRVDNHEQYLQKQLDHDPSILESEWINHPSIEGRPDPMGGYHFTGLALLRAGHELPGNPLSEIVPLVFNESVGKSLCEFKDGKMVCECVNTSEVKQITMKESEVPDATNAPSTVGENDTATCPKNQHWDQDQNKCVEDVKQECEAGWHLDTALQKCVPDNPQVNEAKTMSDLRLKAADLELKNSELNEANTQLKEELTAIKNQSKRVQAEYTKHREESTQAKYTQDGKLSEAMRHINSLEEKDKRNCDQIIELTKREQKALIEREDAIKSRDSYKELHGKEHESREAVFAENQKLNKINLDLTNELTESKARETQWMKDKAKFKEDLDKAMKHQRYLYEFLKSHNFELVAQ